jgi:hypothetical protein
MFKKNISRLTRQVLTEKSSRKLVELTYYFSRTNFAKINLIVMDLDSVKAAEKRLTGHKENYYCIVVKNKYKHMNKYTAILKKDCKVIKNHY